MKRKFVKLIIILAIIIMVSPGCTLLGAVPPSIVVYEISPSTITSGGSSILIWNVTGADSVNIDQGIGRVAVAGSYKVTPGETKAYTLTASNNFGTVSRSVVVIVNAPIVVDLEVDKGIINVGSSTTLRWNVTGATSVRIEPNIGSVPLSGTREVAPTTTTSYTLTASNGTATVAKSLVLIVNRPPVVAIFEVQPAQISYGGSATLRWNVAGASSIRIEPGIGEVNTSGTKVVSPSTTTTYVLTATSSCCAISKSVTIYVGSSYVPSQLPTITLFSINPGVIRRGQTALLEWVVAGADSVNIDQGIGMVPSYGSRVVSPPEGTTTFTLIAASSRGYVIRSITIVVVPP